jgi:hypothetical protein
MKPSDWPPTITTRLSPPPDAAERSLPAQGRVPLAVLAGIGEQLAAGVSAVQRQGGSADAALARLEAWGVQLQELAQVLSRGLQLRQERVDLGLALLQTLAEWSGEADRRGAELHGPACSVQVQCNPAALKHLLDLLLEHGLQQGRSVRLDIEAADADPFVRLVVQVDAAPASSCPERDTLAWQLVLLLSRALMLVPERSAVPGGERLVLPLPRGA